MAASDMKLYFQRHGFIENDLAFNLAVPHPASWADRNPKAEWIKVPCYTVLINHPDVGWILYDSGPHPIAMDNLPPGQKGFFNWYSDKEEYLDKQLKKVGITPADIDILIISHIHPDHVANVHLFEGTKAGASILVEKKELEAALLGAFAKPVDEFSMRRVFCLPGLGYKPIEEDTVLADGVELITMEGHSPGMLGLVVHLPKTGTWLFPSDAILDRRNWGPPPHVPGRIYDSLGWMRTIKKVDGILKKYDGTIIYPHDLAQYETLKQTPEYYE